MPTKSTQVDVALCKVAKYSKSSIQYKDRFLAEMELHSFEMTQTHRRTDNFLLGGGEPFAQTTSLKLSKYLRN